MSAGVFDPRAAALNHAGDAEEQAQVGSQPAVLGELASAVACGLVYVGDVLENVRRELWNAQQRQTVTEPTAGPVGNGEGIPVARFLWVQEWLAALRPDSRAWVLSFPPDLLGHPLLAAAIEDAAVDQMPRNDLTREELVARIRSHQASLREGGGHVSAGE